MTSLQQVIDRARWDYLNTGPEEALNILDTDISTTDTVITLSHETAGIARGARLSVGLEDLYVWDVTPASKQVTVQRGWRGSDPATHTAGTTVYVNTRPTDSQLFRAVNDELRSLTPDLYQIRTVSTTYNASIDGYNLTGVDSILSVYRIRYQSVGPEQEWPTLDRSTWELARNLPPASFPSSYAVLIRSYVDPGRTLLVEYKAPFDPLTTVGDDVENTSGLYPEAHDLLSIGAAVRLTAGREVQRVRDDTQGSTRRAQEVPAGANIGAYRALNALYLQRRQQETGRLQRLYPELIRS